MVQGRGQDDVDISRTVLVFITSGYFIRKNCVRELLRAYVKDKGIIALIEMEALLAGMEPSQIRERLATTEAKLEEWGLAREVDEWNVAPLPTAHNLTEALLSGPHPPLEWGRLSPYQDATLRLLAERLLPEVFQGATYLQGEICHQRVGHLRRLKGRQCHLFVSEQNAGASELVDELRRMRGLALVTTSKQAELPQCDAMLVYLNDLTWTSGEVSAAFGREVLSAMEAGVQLHLAHEMPGLGQEGRSAAPFDSFFACDRGATPVELLRCGIYDSIAMALKGGQLRSVGLALLHQAITRPGSISVSGHLSKYLTSLSLRRSAIDPVVSRTDGSAQLNQVGEASSSWTNVLSLVRGRALRNWRLRTPAAGESSSILSGSEDASSHELGSVSPVMLSQLPQEQSQPRRHSASLSVSGRSSRRYEAMDNEEDGL
jgi:hypothetical protein